MAMSPSSKQLADQLRSMPKRPYPDPSAYKLQKEMLAVRADLRPIPEDAVLDIDALNITSIGERKSFAKTKSRPTFGRHKVAIDEPMRSAPDSKQRRGKVSSQISDSSIGHRVNLPRPEKPNSPAIPQNPLAVSSAMAVVSPVKNAAGANAKKHPSIGKYFCYTVVSYPRGVNPQDDCSCRRKVGSVCAPYTKKNGSERGCNCRYCMALDVADLKRRPGSNVTAAVLVNRKGRPSESRISANGHRKFHCGAKLRFGRKCSAVTGSRCRSCEHLINNWEARGYRVIQS